MGKKKIQKKKRFVSKREGLFILFFFVVHQIRKRKKGKKSRRKMDNKENVAFHKSIPVNSPGYVMVKNEKGATISPSDSKDTTELKIPISVPSIDRRDLANVCERVIAVLEKKDVDWTDRIDALEKLSKVTKEGAALHDEFLDYVVRLRDPLVVQVKDLRSAIVKEACLTVGAIAETIQAQALRTGSRLPSAWAGVAIQLVDACIKQTPVTIKVISESADKCIRKLVSCCGPQGVQKILMRFCAGLQEKAAVVRLGCISYIELALLSWPSMLRTNSGPKRIQEVRDGVKSALQDSDNQVRVAARSCFWALHKSSENTAMQLYHTLDSSTQRRLNDARESATVVASGPVPFEKRQGAAIDKQQKSSAADVAVEQQHKATKGPSFKSRAVRVHQRPTQEEYQASEYASGSLQQQQQRRMAAPQRVAHVTKAPRSKALGQPGVESKAPHHLGGAIRVEQPQAPVPLKDDAIGEMVDPGIVVSSASSMAKLERHLKDLQGSHHWSTRVEAVDVIIRNFRQCGDTLPQPFVEKAVPILCERISDPHHKVAEAVLRCVSILFKHYQKEFNENLKTLMPGLLGGLGNSKASIKRACNENFALCLEYFSHDSLANVLCSVVLRIRSEQLRFHCCEKVAQLVPSAQGYFGVQLHISQLLNRLVPVLGSRKVELRNAGTSVLLALYRFDQQAFIQITQSPELNTAVRDAVRRALASKISGIEKLLIEPTSDIMRRNRIRNSSTPAVPPTVPDANVAVISPTSTTDSTTAMTTNSSTSASTTFSSNDPVPSAPLCPDDATDTDAQLPVPPPQEPCKEEPVENESAPILALPNREQISGDALAGNLLSTLTIVASGGMEQSAALEHLLYILKSNRIDWKKWLTQLLTATFECINASENESIRKIGITTIDAMIKIHPRIVDDSLEMILRRLVDYQARLHGTLSSYASQVLNTAASLLNPDRCYKSLFEIICTRKEVGILHAALTALRITFANVKSSELFNSLPQLVPILTNHIEHAEAIVRRSSMQCFVALDEVLGDAFLPFFQMLPPAKQKLITMYIERKTEHKSKART